MDRKLKLNTLIPLVNQVIVIVCGFILPVLILRTFGSAVNGLVNSISQFLGFITLLDLGVSAVVQSALYKPLAYKDSETISKIYVSAARYFKVIGLLFLVYIFLLAIFYPTLVDSEFSWIFTVSLLLCISINLFAQYYFGAVNNILLNADNRGYVQNVFAICAQILNVIICIILINAGFSIHAVKLATSLIFILRPLGMAWYVEKHYQIDKHISYDTEPIQQKWNGLAQHFAYLVLTNTDIMVLTCFSTLSNVSVYSVYNLVTTGIKQLIMSLMNGIRALMGKLWAKQQIADLYKLFSWVEWIIHSGAIAIWGATAILIVPFIQVYTRGINDANYVVPLFAMLICCAYMGECLRLPYNLMILVAGHYKQTQNNYILASLLNIVISIVAVKYWGLVGVAIGTLIAMFYQTFWMAHYISKELLKWPFRNFIKQFSVDVISLIVIYTTTMQINLTEISYVAWGCMALKVMAIICIDVIAINILFYPKNLIALKNRYHKK